MLVRLVQGFNKLELAPSVKLVSPRYQGVPTLLAIRLAVKPQELSLALVDSL